MKKICVIFCLIIVVIVCSGGCETIKINNTNHYTELVTKKYSTDQIESLKESIFKEEMKWSKFTRQFSVQCMRETYQGYYVVLLQENGDKVFVFADKNMKLYRVVNIDEFKTKDELMFQISKLTTKSEVLSMDPEPFFMPVSAFSMTAHYVKEGVVLVTYTRTKDGIVLSDQIIDSMEFYSNDELLEDSNTLVGICVPYILEMDKYIS